MYIHTYVYVYIFYMYMYIDIIMYEKAYLTHSKHLVKRSYYASIVVIKINL